MVEKKSGKSVEEGKACAVLSYILVGIIWFFVDEKMRKNAYAKFHVKQALVLLGLSIAVNIVMFILGIFATIFAFIPGVGLIIGGIIWLLVVILWLGVLVLWIIGVLNSLNGKEKELPVVGKYSKYLTF